LRPILGEDGGRERFILTDKKDRFYVWDEWDGRLLWVRHVELEELETLEEKVDFVLDGLGCFEVEPVYRTKHPTDNPDLETLRNTYPKHRI
jgi:hypothetical protein